MRYRNKGFTVIEVLVALFIFMITILGLIPGLVISIRVNKMNEIRDLATRVLDLQIKELYEKSYSDFRNIDNNTTVKTVNNWTFYCKYSLDNASDSYMKKVIVTVIYKKPYSNDNASVSSIIFLRKER